MQLSHNCELSLNNISNYFIYVKKVVLVISKNILILRHLWVQGGLIFLVVLESLDQPNFLVLLADNFAYFK